MSDFDHLTRAELVSEAETWRRNYRQLARLTKTIVNHTDENTLGNASLEYIRDEAERDDS